MPSAPWPCWCPQLAPRLRGIEQADSIAFDFHKWLQVPYDAGFLVVRDRQLHLRTFATHEGTYLSRGERGMAAGSPWPCDFGPDLSRGFRALKTWFTIKVYGTERLGGMIAHTCALAQELARRIDAEPELEMLAPPSLNIVCFRFIGTGLNAHGSHRTGQPRSRRRPAGIRRGRTVIDRARRPLRDPGCPFQSSQHRAGH
ncbi:pyridoxal phosphate-dependent decarboxylase family protein [Cupriavidus basilensis]